MYSASTDSMAAEIEAKEKLKDITDCPICLETYKDPKILPCIHTFCMHCLRETGEKLNKNPGDKMPCPICRTEFAIPETGFGGLQKNFFMDKLTEIKNILQPSSSRNLCDACREGNETVVEADVSSAEMYCIQCHQRLCSDCHKQHSRYKLTKKHQTISIAEFKSDDMQETLKTDSCEKHESNLLEIFCTGCQEAVCSICFVEDHQLHVGTDINKVAVDFRKEIMANIDEFSSLLPQLRQQEQKLDNYKDELLRCTEYIQDKVNTRRQELHELVDKHAESLLLELGSIRHSNLKKSELDKENLDTLLVCLESYKAYCLQLITVGSATDICRAKTALEARTDDLKHLYASSGNSPCPSLISLKITDLENGLRFPHQNIVGELEDTGKSINHYTQQKDAMKETPPQEDEEDDKDKEKFLECTEWSMEIDGSSLQDQLNESKQRISSMLDDINELNVKLENETVHLKEVEEKKALLADRYKELELSEAKFRKTVEDLNSQVTLLRNMVYGGGEQSTDTKGKVTCDVEVTRTKTLETFSQKRKGYEIYGIAILENELFVVGNDTVTVVYDLPTLAFKRRWKVQRDEYYDDVKQCDANRCLYLMRVESEEHKPNEIIRVDPNGNEVAAWSVENARGQLSVTTESNILLTASSLNELHEYTPDGKLVHVIRIPWNSGIEKAAHAIKLTSDHFLVCHGHRGDLLIRVCIMDSAGNVLKYYCDQLYQPIYLDIDGVGNVLVVDIDKVLLLSSSLKFKRNIVTYTNTVKKVCFDKINGRVLIVKNVTNFNSNMVIIEDRNVVSVVQLKH